MGPHDCIDASAIPLTREGFYATNNQFQRRGPKGFMEVKVLENNELYVRVDMPGVPDDAVLHRIDSVRKKVVFFSGETPPAAETQREYSGCAGLGCDCCDITGVNATMKDGVLRMLITRVKVKDEDMRCTLTLPTYTGKSGRYLEDHPFVVKGPKRAHFAKATEDGRLCATFDVPGASADDVRVFLEEDEVRFYVETEKVCEHDESGRAYLGSIGYHGMSGVVFNWEAKHGILHLFLSPN
ncbi:PREDICTED: uncharacterized protein LOC104798375 [Tarenaya hassleriana]|uniref:uncharacterized protein LOC104798375 n=1 Tax=Tarenaya hassleriana TaxID=28532 RepID=UPI00053C55AE|nr:PREDICTED: uncharacterized protein LOC104798375 [Tarenaya hassleriana]